MRFRRFCVENVGPHARLDLTFKEGSVGLFGPNGSGKSTVLNGMYALLSNDFRRFHGVKTDCVNNAVKGQRGAVSRLSGELEHNGTVFTLTRGIKPVEHCLRVEGEADELTDSRKIAERLEELLGITPDMLDLYVFKDQGQVYDFLSATPGQMARMYQTLCRTERCEQIYDLLGEYINKDQEARADVQDNSDDLTAQIVQTETEVERLQAERDQARGSMLDGRGLKHAERVVKKAQRADHYVKEKTLLEKRLAKAQKAVERLERWAARRRKQAGKARRAAQKAQRGAFHAKQALDRLVFIGSAEASVERCLRRLRELEAEAASKQAPVAPDWLDAFDPQAARNRLARLGAAMNRARKLVDLFVTKGVTECPTCGTEVDTLSDSIEQSRQLLREGKVKCDELNARLDAYDAHGKAQMAFERWRSAHEGKVQTVAADRLTYEHKLAELGDKPATPPEELRATIAAHEQACVAQREAERAVTDCAAELAAATGTAGASKTRLEEIAVWLEANTPPPLVRLKAKGDLAQHRLAEHQVAHLDGRIAALEDGVRALREQVGRLRRRLVRARRVKLLVAEATAVRDAMHPTGLPAVVARTNLVRLEADINGGLKCWGGPFLVTAGDDLTFQAHKPGERPHPAGALSGGQKVVLAINFWMAVASLWKADVGMMGLDEPTAFLDEDNRGLLAEALRRWSASLRGRHQLIMTSHADNLRQCFDQVVVLGQPG